MKIAVAMQGQTQVAVNLGRCRDFWIYETEDRSILTKEALTLPTELTFRRSSPQETHPLDSVQVLISGWMGKGLHRRLTAKNIEPLITQSMDPDIAIASYLNGSLKSDIESWGKHKPNRCRRGNSHRVHN